jgi:hypothetical protein
MASLASDSDLDLSFSIKWGTESIADLQLLVTTIASGTANALGKQADLNNVMRYMAVSQFIDNSDGINNNYYLVRTKSNSRFQMLPWDLDYSFNTVHHPSEGAFFSRNAFFTRVFSDACLKQAWSGVVETLELPEMSRSLTDYADTVFYKIQEAYAHDLLLSNGSLTLEQHLEQLKTFLFEAQAVR